MDEPKQQTFFDRLPPEVVARIKERRLLISDIEPDVKIKFKDLAKIYFNNSYPATVKYLLDCNEAMNASHAAEVEARIDALAQTVAELQSKLNAPTEPQVKQRKMNDGITTR